MKYDEKELITIHQLLMTERRRVVLELNSFVCPNMSQSLIEKREELKERLWYLRSLEEKTATMIFAIKLEKQIKRDIEETKLFSDEFYQFINKRFSEVK